MPKNIKQGILKSFSGLTINLSAAWFALAFITPNFSRLDNPEAITSLTINLVFGILLLALNIILESKQK